MPRERLYPEPPAQASDESPPEVRSISYGYDGLLRLTDASISGGTTYSYTYDLAGNRTEVWVNGVLTQALSYNEANQVIGWTYDEAGNLLDDGTTTYAWDALGRMTQRDTTLFSYNGDGVLVAQDDGVQVTRYTQDLVAPLSQVLADGTSTYIYGHERLAGKARRNPVWYGSDALGSVRLTLTGGGRPLQATHYDRWGMPEQGMIAPFGFTGELQDAATSLVYLRARWYHPAIGTFPAARWRTSESNDFQPLSHHAYVYSLNNPVIYTDPSGKCVDERVPLIGEPGCRVEAGVLQGQLDLAGTGQYAWNVFQGIGLPGAMLADAITGGNATQRIIEQGGVGTILGGAFSIAATGGLSSAVGNGTVASLLAARAGTYGVGYAYYHGYHSDNPLMTIPGYILGYENIYQDLKTIMDCDASIWRRGLAAGDAMLNAVLGMTMLSGLRSSAQSFRVGGTLNDLSVMDRLSFLQRLAARSHTTLLELTNGIPYRPLGEQVIQLSRSALRGNAWKLSGSVYHELAHVGQEFGKLRTLARPAQRLSAWAGALDQGNVATKVAKGLAFLGPGYLFNPVEVHAFSSGLASPINAGYLMGGRIIAGLLNDLINGG